eukprot:53411-Eustigmatos_ZCMA.PRE.1
MSTLTKDLRSLPDRTQEKPSTKVKWRDDLFPYDTTAILINHYPDLAEFVSHERLSATPDCVRGSAASRWTALPRHITPSCANEYRHPFQPPPWLGVHRTCTYLAYSHRYPDCARGHIPIYMYS